MTRPMPGTIGPTTIRPNRRTGGDGPRQSVSCSKEVTALSTMALEGGILCGSRQLSEVMQPRSSCLLFSPTPPPLGSISPPDDSRHDCCRQQTAVSTWQLPQSFHSHSDGMPARRGFPPYVSSSRAASEADLCATPAIVTWPKRRILAKRYSTANRPCETAATPTILVLWLRTGGESERFASEDSPFPSILVTVPWRYDGKGR